jgi:hypothetical protein
MSSDSSSPHSRDDEIHNNKNNISAVNSKKDKDDGKNGNFILPLDELEKTEQYIHLAEIAITVCKYIPVIIGVLAAISLGLAVYDFVVRDYFWAIVNLVLGLAGASFVARVIKPHPRHFAKESDVAHNTSAEAN